MSYASPIAPVIPEYLRNLNGCPFKKRDVRWVADEAVDSLSSSLRDAAARAGTRFLDMSEAGLGHEACSGGRVPGTEWFNRLMVDWNDLEQVGRASHASQGSFHPNAKGQAQYARCLNDFLPSHRRTAACVVDSGGNLHATVDSAELSHD